MQVHDMDLVGLQGTIERPRDLIIRPTGNEHLRVRTLQFLKQLRKYRGRILQALPTCLIQSVDHNYHRLPPIQVTSNLQNLNKKNPSLIKTHSIQQTWVRFQDIVDSLFDDFIWGMFGDLASNGWEINSRVRG